MQSDDGRARTAGSTLTPEVLEGFWPLAQKRVVRSLRAQGIDAATAEDAVAEAATRALSRGLLVDDVEDFCRWAFVVARNVALDTSRRSRRLVSLESVADRADHYDLVRHVEVRQTWRETAHAMGSLSVSDRTALLDTLDDEQAATRREAVKHAVRRHRARLRLRHALGQAGGFLGGLRRLWDWRVEWLASYDRAGAVMLASIVAAAGSWFGHAPVAPVQTNEVAAALPVVASSVRVDDARAAGVVAAPRSDSRTDGGEAREAVGPTPAEAMPVGYGFAFTPSPAYDDDHTVFASAGHRSDDCGTANENCSLLYKSTDGGVSWTRLAARDRDYGTILLPPAYPRDPRIFSAGHVLSVSTDGGESFSVVAPGTGPAAMSPLFSSAEPRIVFGSDRALRSASPMEYRDGAVALTPLKVPLPAGTVAMNFWYGPDYARDGHFFVTAVEPPTVLGPGGTPMIRVDRTGFYDCTDTACARVLDLSSTVLTPSVVWSTRTPGAMFVGSTSDLSASVDGGASFVSIGLPGSAPRRMLNRLASGPGGRLYASIGNDAPGVTRLFASDDDGATWRLLREDTASYYSLTALPDGALLDARQDANGGITCSVDGGRTWADRCHR
jgi:DNA-directed RNA polymerase specialized sigma24 family protein